MSRRPHYWDKDDRLASVEKLRAENERLRAEYPYSEVDLEMAVEGEVKELRAEIERLRYLNREELIERLTALNAELLAALRPFVNARIVDATMRRTARAAVAKVVRGK